MTPEDVAWLAGILEGEGHFGDPQQNPLPSPRTARITLAMSDQDVVSRVADLFGSRVLDKRTYPTELGRPRKQQWQTIAYGVRALEIMGAIRPFMGARRGARIDEITEGYYAARPHLSREDAA